MWRLKGCNRCGGDIYIDKDEYGWYEECLQCGYRAELPEITDARRLPAAAEKQMVPVKR